MLIIIKTIKQIFLLPSLTKSGKIYMKKYNIGKN